MCHGIINCTKITPKCFPFWQQDSVSEGGGPVTFTVERTQGTEGNVDVRWEIEAAGASDLTPSSGTLSFQQVSVYVCRSVCFQSRRMQI